MEKIYSKINPQILLLTINRRANIEKERNNLCPDKEYLQVSTKKLSKGVSFVPHKHNELHRVSDITQEAWIFLAGKVKAKFWDIDDTFIYETELGPGDCAVVFRGGHSFDVLEDDTILYEVKTGPYYGVERDKTIIGERNEYKI
jgi:mannose-6-phosphate isomerase-like protein (cupin superfamily)